MSDEIRQPEEPDDVDREVELDAIEPSGAVRLSPYAIAAFVVSVIGLAPGQPFSAFFFIFPSAGRAEFAVMMLSAVVPVGTAVLAFWLAGRGELEIISSDGRVGGVGFCRAARAVALLTMILLVASVLVGLAFGDRTENFGAEAEPPDQPPAGYLDEGFAPSPVEPGEPPPPIAPAQPAQPAVPIYP